MNKISKKFLSLLLTALMVLSSAAAAFANTDPVLPGGSLSETVSWSFNEATGELVVNGAGAIPGFSLEDDYPNYPWNAYIPEITSLTVGEGITGIGTAVFAGLYEMTEAFLPSTLKSIGAYAFYYAVSLEELILPEGLESIGGNAFEYCVSLDKLVIPSTLREIGERAFSSAYFLTDITVNSLEVSVFDTMYCLHTDDDRCFRVLYAYALSYYKTEAISIWSGTVMTETDYYLPIIPIINEEMGLNITSAAEAETVVSDMLDNCAPGLGGYVTIRVPEDSDAHDYCRANYQQHTVNGAQCDCFVLTGSYGENITWTLDRNTRTLTLDGSGRIPETASPFAGMAGQFDSIKFAEGATIENINVKLLSGLESVDLYIPAGNITIDRNVFTYYEARNAVNGFIVDADNPNYSSDEYGVLFNKDKTVLYSYPQAAEKIQEYTVPATVTEIGEEAFENARLGTLYIGSGVTTLGNYSVDAGGIDKVVFAHKPNDPLLIGYLYFNNGTECVACAGSAFHHFAESKEYRNGQRVNLRVIDEKDIASIDIVSPANEREFMQNAIFVATGLSIRVNYADETCMFTNCGFTVTGSTASLGETVCTVDYNGVTADYTINIAEYTEPEITELGKTYTFSHFENEDTAYVKFIPQKSGKYTITYGESRYLNGGTCGHVIKIYDAARSKTIGQLYTWERQSVFMEGGRTYYFRFDNYYNNGKRQYYEYEIAIACVHDFTEEPALFVPATCCKNGTECSVCATCGECRQTLLPMTAHTDENKDGLCDVCGQSADADNDYYVIDEINKSVYVAVAANSSVWLKYDADDTMEIAVSYSTLVNPSISVYKENKDNLISTYNYFTCNSGCSFYVEVKNNENRDVIAELSLDHERHHADDIEIVEAPDCTDEGTGRMLCMDCGKCLSDAVAVPPLHTDENGDGICDLCGKEVFGWDYKQEVSELTDSASVTVTAYMYKFNTPVKYTAEKSGTVTVRMRSFNCGVTYPRYQMYDSAKRYFSAYSYNRYPNDDITELTFTAVAGETYYFVTALENYYYYSVSMEYCDAIQVEFSVLDHEHNFVFAAWNTKLTCFYDGYSKYQCTACGVEKNEYVSRIVHENPEQVYTYYDATEATCTEPGYAAYTYCSECDAWSSHYETAPATNHANAYAGEAVAATCTTDGHTAGLYCPDCDTWVKRQHTVKATNHKNAYAGEAVAATCTTEGRTAGLYCPDCDTWIVEQKTVPGEHITAEETVEPTCVFWGYHSVYCTVCYEELVNTPLEPLGHDYNEALTENVTLVSATCTENGLKTVKCSRCDAVEETVLTAPGHSFGDWLVTVPATIRDEGTQARTCVVCGFTETRATDRLPCEEQTDTATGASFRFDEAAYDGDVTFSVGVLSQDECYYRLPGVYAVFNITTTVNGEKAQPKTPVLVTVPLPDFISNPANLRIYHINGETGAQERVEDVRVYAENGITYAEFFAASFSDYIIAETQAECAHLYAAVSRQPATCTDSGTTLYTCTFCGDTYSEVIPPVGHRDDNGDGNCDVCGEKIGSQTHTGLFGDIFEKIREFFNKIFDFFRNFFG